MQSPQIKQRILMVACVATVGLLVPNATAQVQNESTKLLNLNGMASDELGVSVALSGDVLVAGAHQAPADPQQPGYAVVFRRINGIWVEEQTLTALDGAPKDEFGEYVALSGDVIVVGAWLDDGNVMDAGSAYVFRYDETETVCGAKWCQEQELFASDGITGDQFGIVAVSGDAIIVTAFKHSEAAFGSGAAYAFRYDPDQTQCGEYWCEEQEILAPDGAISDSFGYSVSMEGNLAAIGSIGGDGVEMNAGAVYIYRWNGATWAFEQKVFASDGVDGELFGRSVSISGDAILVGTWLDDEQGFQSGSAYMFRYDESETVCGSKWCQEEKLLPADGEEGDIFGISASLDGNIAVVGAGWHDHGTSQSGAAYEFRYDPSENFCGKKWCQHRELRASDAEVNDVLGLAVSISGHTAVVGSLSNNENGDNAGAVYVFELNEAIPAASQWGVALMTLLLLTTGSLLYKHG